MTAQEKRGARVSRRAVVAGAGGVLVASSLAAQDEPEEAGADFRLGPRRRRRAAPLPRADHATALLPGGLVLVIGGVGIDGTLASCQIYDPDDDRWYDAAPLRRPRGLHSATTLPGGDALILGGYDGDALASASLYDPARDRWTAVHPLRQPRYRHTAQALPDGRVVVTGGFYLGPLAQAEVYSL